MSGAMQRLCGNLADGQMVVMLADSHLAGFTALEQLIHSKRGVDEVLV